MKTALLGLLLSAAPVLALGQTPAATAAAPAAAATAAAPAAVVAASTPSAAAFKPPKGWRLKSKQGDEPRYCRKDVSLGSRFATEQCLTQAQLQQQEAMNEANRVRFSQSTAICASASGGANP
jgi:invasion protein IalB